MRAVIGILAVVVIAALAWFFFLRGDDPSAMAMQARDLACAEGADIEAATAAVAQLNEIDASALGDEVAASFNAAKAEAEACLAGDAVEEAPAEEAPAEEEEASDG